MNVTNNSPMQQHTLAVLSPLRNSGDFGTGYKYNASATSRGDGPRISINVRMIHFQKSPVFCLRMRTYVAFVNFCDTRINLS